MATRSLPGAACLELFTIDPYTRKRHGASPGLEEKQDVPAQHDMNAVTAMIMVVGGVQRLMNVTHEMNREAQGLGAYRQRKPAVGDYLLIAVDLGHPQSLFSQSRYES
jgi:hypothetical protein